jgi:4-hydroxy-2-oxoheptanedioate aldolase
MRTNTVKRLLKAGKPSVGTWLSLGSVTAARFLARAGFDWLTIDIEHSLVGMENTANMIASIADAGCVPLARVPANKHDHIKRVLDNGGYGVVVPMVTTPQEARDAVSACLYPPRGTRSVGGSVHALNFGCTPAEYYAKADDELLIVLQCEHIDAVRNFDAVYGGTGADAIYVGPNDLAASMRDATGKPPSAEEFRQALADILAGCKRIGIAPGIHTFSIEEAKTRIADGWQLIAVNSELRFLTDGAKQVVDALGLKSAQLTSY